MGKSTRGGPGPEVGKLSAADLKDLEAKEFTELQRLFVRAYLRHRDAARAVREAGYGCKFENARAIGHRLLQRPHIKAFIEARTAELLEELDISANSVLGELARIGRANIAKIMVQPDDGGPPQFDLANADENLMRAIQEVTITTRMLPPEEKDGEPIEQREVKIKLAGKTEALGLLGKHLKLFTDKVELSGSVDIAAGVQRARDVARQRLIAMEGTAGKPAAVAAPSKQKRS
jgi:phage terminase small subunit